MKRDKLIKRSPSVATLGNAAAGLVACGLAVTGRPGLGAIMVLVAVLMDAFDGALARSFDAASDFGAELDSLADCISFGVAPAMLAGRLLSPAILPVGWLLLIAYPLCAIWRLARYNAGLEDADSHREFQGLPTTGAGAAAATAALFYLRLSAGGVVLSDVFLPCVLLLLAVLMVGPITYKHAGAVVSRLSPAAAVSLAALLVAGAALWEYEYTFAALVWGYVASGPLAAVREKIRAVRHA
jgi:CDP-diacylglycerol--serine O-phosphatidyltransferase